MMITCVSCKHENRVGEKYCESCGEELPKASTAPVPPTPQPVSLVVPSTAVPPPSPATATTSKKVATLICNKVEYDIHEGQTLVIARADTDKCVPDIAIEDLRDDPKVSSRPIRITGDAIPTDPQTPRTLTVEGEVEFRLVRTYFSGQTVSVYPGDIILAGDKAVKIE